MTSSPPATALPSRALGYIRRKTWNFWDAALPPAARRGRRAGILRELRDVSFTSITFVCQGNINRSALAEGRWRAMDSLVGLSVHSCGLHKRGGRTSPHISVKAAASLGVDLHLHRSKVAGDLSPADTLLVGFEPHHLRAWHGCDVRESAAVLLGVFDDDDGAPLHIPDPYNRDADYVRAVFARVIRCVDHLASRMERIDARHWRLRS